MYLPDCARDMKKLSKLSLLFKVKSRSSYASKATSHNTRQPKFLVKFIS